MLSKDDLERERYRARIKKERDDRARMRDAIEEGLKKGLEQGREEGRVEGFVIGRIHAYQQILKTPITPEEDLLALPLHELEARMNKLEQQLGLFNP